MKDYFLILLCMFTQWLPYNLQAQQGIFILKLKDKNNTVYSLENPEEFLTEKSISRRAKAGISIDSTDLPVNTFYIETIQQTGAQIINTSKWLNQVMVRILDNTILNTILALPFVQSTINVAPRKSSRKYDTYISGRPVRSSSKMANNNVFNYGPDNSPITIHEGEFLHNHGYSGKGIFIALLDAGFRQYNTNPVFDSLQIGDVWDFVAHKNTVQEEHEHGAQCLSAIAANKPGTMVGSAPHATYFLYRTENVAGEYPTEEQNWIAAAERADSLGVDIINSSLGYYEFDNPSLSYGYPDMDGKTAMITQGAEMAAQKGILVVNSAGNTGASAWKYIVAPADGQNVLAVGAVTKAGLPADFSAYGPSFDGRLKPNVASLGAPGLVARTNGTTQYVNGTSIAGPNLAGLAACLWQAFPEYNSMDIFEAIEKSGHQYNTPDDRMGYGIPNMQKAYELLLKKRTANEDAIREEEEKRKKEEALRQQMTALRGKSIKVFPNPFTQYLNVILLSQQSGKNTLHIRNNLGYIVYSAEYSTEAGIPFSFQIPNLSHYTKGMYWLQYNDGKELHTVPITKQ